MLFILFNVNSSENECNFHNCLNFYVSMLTISHLIFETYLSLFFPIHDFPFKCVSHANGSHLALSVLHVFVPGIYIKNIIR